MKILVDENILYAQELFGQLGIINIVNGRNISLSSLLDIDAIIIRSITQVNKNLLDGSKVRFVGTATIGTDHVDKYWLSEAGITFSNAPGCNAIAVVEYVLSALLWLSNRDNFLLRNKIVGIVGYGNIGSRLQKRLEKFGIHTIICDPLLAEAGVPGDWISLEKIINEADIITFHTPLTYSGSHATWHLIDESLLSSLPSGRTIINTSRGAVIDNSALLRVLKSGKRLSVILDVWEHEPNLSFQLLEYVDIGTAHIAGHTVEGKIRGSLQLFEAYSSFLGKKVSSMLSILHELDVKQVKFCGDINERKIFLLSRMIYDIKNDDIKLRNIAKVPEKFDLLRKYYDDRREWSSLCVNTSSKYIADYLKCLGFRVLINLY